MYPQVMYVSFHSGLIFSNMDVSNASIDHYIQDKEETQEDDFDGFRVGAT